jgi:hypothetical protein
MLRTLTETERTELGKLNAERDKFSQAKQAEPHITEEQYAVMIDNKLTAEQVYSLGGKYPESPVAPVPTANTEDEP